MQLRQEGTHRSRGGISRGGGWGLSHTPPSPRLANPLLAHTAFAVGVETAFYDAAQLSSQPLSFRLARLSCLSLLVLALTLEVLYQRLSALLT